MKSEKGFLSGLILNIALLVATSNALAWGENGHQIVGEIAWVYLQPEVKTEVEQLLRVAGEPGLAEASTWADRIRREEQYKWTAPLHYINLPHDWSGYIETRDCPPAGCIVKALEKYEEVLSSPDATQSERAQALMFVAHFVGDLHQPMHTGLREDRGGNDIEVHFFGFPTNLHALWDVYLPAGFAADWRNYAQQQQKEISEAQRLAWQNSNKYEWTAESQHLAHNNAYTDDPNLGEDYYRRNREVVEQRLRQGGVRLAGLLNQAISPQLPRSNP
ncbi:S1/P1 nuclease [Microbulbifer aggregans]|uniref:S1/P1 nuclease n=1 Tax=Microbulbifer aggregans TaxID=1769779 RepID=UPI001CFD162D|nr:S1/P1 nuclease [Microbulbifer aggregans]